MLLDSDPEGKSAYEQLVHSWVMDDNELRWSATGTDSILQKRSGVISIDKDRNAQKPAVVVQMKGGVPSFVALIEPAK